MKVSFGIDRFLASRDPRNKMRIGLVTNQSACTSTYIPSLDALQERGFHLVRLFSPEHGLQAAGADGHTMSDGVEARTGIPICSLYGNRLRPEAGDLSDLDLVLVDLPDVGCRCYTYLWTMSYVLEACAEQGKPVTILDRPNPLSGLMRLAEGPRLEASCASFIGRWDIPLRHSCTLGELASFWRATRLPQLALKVVTVEGWSRKMFYHDWARSFVPTSPAMANAEACLLYPGLCLGEATNLSEGRGTPLAFRVWGAPWLRACETVEAFQALRLPGVTARKMVFVPGTGKWAGQNCQGVMLHVTDAAQFRPVKAAVLLLRAVRDLHPEEFAWAGYPTAVNPTGAGHLDRLLGVEKAGNLFQLAWPEFCAKLEGLLSSSSWESEIGDSLLYA